MTGISKGAGMIKPNMAKYVAVGRQVRKLMQELTPLVEPLSIDEAFLGLAGFSDPEGHGRGLRATVARQTGIPVCVGIASTKTLAKVANRTAKKDLARGGVCLLDTEAAQTEALSKLALDDIWGIGGRLAPKLVALGITTPLELRAADPVMMDAKTGQPIVDPDYALAAGPAANQRLKQKYAAIDQARVTKH